jgi:hypothetical protein
MVELGSTKTTNVPIYLLPSVISLQHDENFALKIETRVNRWGL